MVYLESTVHGLKRVGWLVAHVVFLGLFELLIFFKAVYNFIAPFLTPYYAKNYAKRNPISQ